MVGLERESGKESGVSDPTPQLFLDLPRETPPKLSLLLDLFLDLDLSDRIKECHHDLMIYPFDEYERNVLTRVY